MASSKRILPYLALLGGILALSFSALFVRWASAAGGAPGTVTSFYRMAIASAALLPFFIRQQIKVKFSLPWKWLPLAVLAGVFSALDHSIWSTSIQYTRVANATLLNNISPLWVAFVAALVFKEKLPGRFWFGLVLTLVGAGIVFGNDIISNPHLSWGDALALIASLFYAGYFLFTQLSRRHLNTVTHVWLVCFSATLVLLIICFGFQMPLTGYPAPVYLAFLGAGLISQTFGYSVIGYALGSLPASVVAPTIVAQPVITSLLAIPLFGEKLYASQWIGGLIVLGGIYLVNISQSAKPKDSSPVLQETQPE